MLTMRSAMVPPSTGRGERPQPVLVNRPGGGRPQPVFVPAGPQHPGQTVAELVAPVVPVVAVPRALEQNIDAAFAQELCERPVLVGEPLELAGRHERPRPRQLRRPRAAPASAGRSGGTPDAAAARACASSRMNDPDFSTSPPNTPGKRKAVASDATAPRLAPSSTRSSGAAGDPPARARAPAAAPAPGTAHAPGSPNTRRAGRASAPAPRSPAGSRPRRSGCRAPPAGRRRRRSRRRRARRPADRPAPRHALPAGRPEPRASRRRPRLATPISSIRPAGAPRGRLHSGRS